MQLNKEFLTKTVFAGVFILIGFRIIVPLLFDKIKGKSLGLSNRPDDIDYMIKKQKEILKSQYNLIETAKPKEKSSSKENTPQEINKVQNELSWGGTELQKDLKNKIVQSFGYQFSDSKITAFLTLLEKKNYLAYLNDESDKISKDSINNFLCAIFIFLVICDEIKQKDLSFTKKCADKLGLDSEVLALAIQIKLLSSNNEIKLKENLIYSNKLILSQISDETRLQSIGKIISQEANLWKRSPSMFFEELSLYLTYAEYLKPVQKLKNKQDLEAAYANFNETQDCDLENIKKKYKKLAQKYHPDKVTPQKLPKEIEKAAIEKFNIIQESFQLITSRK